MNAPIFLVCAAAAAVRALLGTTPVRFWPFGLAPQKPELPYAVFRTIFGDPANQLADAPTADAWTLQVDVYAETARAARDVARALRDAIEPHAYITAWRGEDRDPVTEHYNYQFEVDWLLKR